MGGASRAARVAVVLAALLCERTADAAPRAYVIDAGARMRADGDEPGVRRSASADLRAFAGEYAAFQLVVEGDGEPLEAVTVEAPAFEGGVALEIFAEHFVRLDVRSRNDRYPDEALAFTLAARPEDDLVLGEVPDALLPVEVAPHWAYPARVGPNRRAIFWIEAFVPEDAAPGPHETAVVVTADGAAPVRVPVRLTVEDQLLPYRAVSAFAFYERPTLEERFGDPDLVEKRLVRMLHAHHLDVIMQITEPEHADRVRGALDGSWFDRREGYRGPGAGAVASLAPLGAYGTLGEPSEQALAEVRALAARVPGSVDDVFVYAIDEVCDSPRGPRWRALLRDAGLAPRVFAAHTCHLDPTKQDLDLIMIPAQAFDPDTAALARAQGKRIWIYNGQLPFSGAPVLDVPPTSLTVNGWIAASFDVGRWFYWETIFWHDGNRGGRGPTDVFENVETFHNADGDTSLYDGLLAFPGRTPPRLGRHDLGWDGAVPSLRLKSLRRGIEDAAIIALAARVDPEATYAVTKRVVGAALDEVDKSSPVAFELDPHALSAARDELRSIAVRAPRPVGVGARPALDDALAAHRALRTAERRVSGRGGAADPERHTAAVLGLLGVLFGLGLSAALVRGARKRAGRPRA